MSDTGRRRVEARTGGVTAAGARADRLLARTAFVVAAVAMAGLGARRAGAQPAGAGAAEGPRIRSGIAITPDTVTVGDPFVIEVRVAAPAGATVAFPAAPDSTGAVDLLDPKRETAGRSADGGVDVTATYRAAAWDVGAVAVGLGDVVVRVGGVERRVPLGALRVNVRSVLPADSTKRTPKPVRDPVPDAGLWWLGLAAAAVGAVALVALLAWLASRWWRRRARPAAGDAAYGEAMAAFARLDRLGLVDAGEGGRHVALAVDIARDYLAARRPAADRSHTTAELLAAVRDDPEVPADRLAALLGVGDLVKFAGVSPGAAPAREAAQEARDVVEAVETAVQARQAREAAEAAARARAEREARQRYEEERRRAARRERADRAAADDAGRRDRAA